MLEQNYTEAQAAEALDLGKWQIHNWKQQRRRDPEGWERRMQQAAEADPDLEDLPF